MAAPYNPPTKNEEFKTRVALDDMATAGSLKISPTIAAGDFQVDIDGGGFNNLGTLPVVSPAASQGLLIVLSSDEMNGDLIVVRGVDQTSPKEWADFWLNIITTA